MAEARIIRENTRKSMAEAPENKPAEAAPGQPRLPPNVPGPPKYVKIRENQSPKLDLYVKIRKNRRTKFDLYVKIREKTLAEARIIRKNMRK